MDTKEEIKAKRKRLLAKCQSLVDIANEIEEEMRTVKHSRGVAHRSLKPQSGLAIIHTNEGFIARYQDARGVEYSIQIHKSNLTSPDIRKPFIVVHQRNVEEFDSLDAALQGIDETRKDYHQGGYRVYDFEGGVYQIVQEGIARKVRLFNQDQYDKRDKDEDDLKPFAVVDKMDNSKLIGINVNMHGMGTIVLSEKNLPQLDYHGFDNLAEARREFRKRKSNETGVYSLILFRKVPGPDRKE